jgi:hypothetical protein
MSSEDLLTSALDDPDFDEITAAGKSKSCCKRHVSLSLIIYRIAVHRWQVT